MPEFLSYDPLTGVREQIAVEEEYCSDKSIVRIRKEQDVAPILKYAAHLRTSGEADARLKDDDYFCVYAVLPAVVQVELMQKGINIHDPTQTKRLLQEIDRNYPLCKTTDKVHVATH